MNNINKLTIKIKLNNAIYEISDDMLEYKKILRMSYYKKYIVYAIPYDIYEENKYDGDWEQYRTKIFEEIDNCITNNEEDITRNADEYVNNLIQHYKEISHNIESYKCYNENGLAYQFNKMSRVNFTHEIIDKYFIKNDNNKLPIAKELYDDFKAKLKEKLETEQCDFDFSDTSKMLEYKKENK